MSGWIKLHRGLVDWEWYDDHNTTRLFLHCTIRANHKAKSWRGIAIDRGQFWTSLPTLVSETGLSTRQIRTSLDKLKSTGEVTVSSKAQGRMITISNYELYQQDDRQDDRQETDERQTDDRLATANKNVKNDNKEKKGELQSVKPPPCPHLEIIEIYNETLPELQQVISSRWIGSSRANTLVARWKESPKHQSLGFWKSFFSALRGYPFYLGENDRAWKADLAWLIKRENFDKLLEKFISDSQRAA